MLKLLFTGVVALMLVVGFTGVARAADDATATGTWKWEIKPPQGDAIPVTLKLKQDGEKLTGSISGRDNKDTDISDGKVKDGEVSFKVTRKGRDDKEYVTTYHGKLAGDTITGKSERATAGGEARARDWEAKRAKE